MSHETPVNPEISEGDVIRQLIELYDEVSTSVALLEESDQHRAAMHPDQGLGLTSAVWGGERVLSSQRIMRQRIRNILEASGVVLEDTQPEAE